jgi:hypothetical protein
MQQLLKIRSLGLSANVNIVSHLWPKMQQCTCDDEEGQEAALETNFVKRTAAGVIFACRHSFVR